MGLFLSSLPVFQDQKIMLISQKRALLKGDSVHMRKYA